MKSVGVYLRAGRWYAHPYSETVDAGSVFAPPIVILEDQEVNDQRLGDMILELFTHSLTGAPDPDLDAHPDDCELVKAAGFSTWRAFAKGTRFCEVVYLENSFELYPTERDRTGFTFGHLPEKKIVIPGTTGAAQIGAACRLAMESSS